MSAGVALNGTPLSARRCYLMSANVTCVFTCGAWILLYVPSEEEQVGDVYQVVHPPVEKPPRKGRALRAAAASRDPQPGKVWPSFGPICLGGSTHHEEVTVDMQ